MLQVLLVEIQPNTRLMTIFNPWASEKDDDGVRITNALDSLFDTTEAQQVSLYESALIRYFSPCYNKIFKNSFPSTNMKVLQQCYEKDMAAIVAEFCIDEIPYYLCSSFIEIMPYHIVTFNIHDREDRDVFFGQKTGVLKPL